MQKHTPYHLLHKKLTGEINPAESNLLDKLMEVDIDASYSTLESELGEIWNQAEAYNPNVVFNADAAFAKFQERISSEQGDISEQADQSEHVEPSQEQAPQESPAPRKDIKTENEGQPAKVMRMKPTGRLLPLAASLIFLLISGLLLKNYMAGTMITTSDDHTLLADGSQIWLNGGNSEISYPESFDKDRTVRLSGEGYFKVNKGLEPFKVITDAGTVEVTGTEFMIDAGSKNIEVAVVDGSVELNFNGETKTINEKQKAYNQDGGIEVENLSSRNIANWREAGLSFKSDNLATVVRDLKIYFGVDIKTAAKGVDTKCSVITSPNVAHDSSIEWFFDNILNASHKIDYTKNADGSFTINEFSCSK